MNIFMCHKEKNDTGRHYQFSFASPASEDLIVRALFDGLAKEPKELACVNGVVTSEIGRRLQKLFNDKRIPVSTVCNYDEPQIMVMLLYKRMQPSGCTIEHFVEIK